MTKTAIFIAEMGRFNISELKPGLCWTGFRLGWKPYPHRACRIPIRIPSLTPATGDSKPLPTDRAFDGVGKSMDEVRGIYFGTK